MLRVQSMDLVQDFAAGLRCYISLEKAVFKQMVFFLDVSSFDAQCVNDVQ